MLQALARPLPVTIRQPLMAAAMIFLAAVASTQTAVVVMGRQADKLVETLGQVYLDGLSAALLPHIARNDEPAIRATLRQALTFHAGIVDRQLAFIRAADRSVVEVQRPDLAADDPLPAAVTTARSGFLRSGDGTIWIWRELADGAVVHGTVAANLDTSAFDAERSSLRWLLLVVDLAFAGGCAVLGFFVVRRAQRPMAVVAAHLYEAALGMLRPIPAARIPVSDRQAERMIHAFNAMAHASAEREQLLTHLAEQQRAADLGRLVATVAHEVRNPLGGMRTAVSTLKRFGDQAEPRRESVAFLERGISALQHVVDATLENYRSRPEWRPLTRGDFEDLRLLVEADGRSRDVALDFDIAVPDMVPVAALDVRQVLLNLLLNAVRASARGDRVHLRVRIEAQELVICVSDQGGGLDGQLAESMESGMMPPQGPGLGVAVVIRLVEQLQGRVSIDSAQGKGTKITLNLPLRNGAALS